MTFRDPPSHKSKVGQLKQELATCGVLRVGLGRSREGRRRAESTRREEGWERESLREGGEGSGRLAGGSGKRKWESVLPARERGRVGRCAWARREDEGSFLCDL